MTYKGPSVTSGGPHLAQGTQDRERRSLTARRQRSHPPGGHLHTARLFLTSKFISKEPPGGAGRRRSATTGPRHGQLCRGHLGITGTEQGVLGDRVVALD